MKGYLILEFNLPDGPPDGGVTIGEILDTAKTALGGPTIERVTHVHAAIGLPGLREAVAYLEDHRP